MPRKVNYYQIEDENRSISGQKYIKALVKKYREEFLKKNSPLCWMGAVWLKESLENHSI